MITITFLWIKYNVLLILFIFLSYVHYLELWYYPLDYLYGFTLWILKQACTAPFTCLYVLCWLFSYIVLLYILILLLFTYSEIFLPCLISVTRFSYPCFTLLLVSSLNFYLGFCFVCFYDFLIYFNSCLLLLTPPFPAPPSQWPRSW